MRYSTYDVFQKPVEGLRNKSVTGAVITIIAASVTFILFLSQLYLYASVNTLNHLTIAQSSRASLMSLLHPHIMDQERELTHKVNGKKKVNPRVLVKIHVTFPHIKCMDLDIEHDGARGEDFKKLHGRDSVQKRVPTLAEITEAGVDGKASLRDGCTIQGKMLVPKVGGSISITVARSSWQMILMNALFHMSQRHEQIEHQAYDPFAGGASQTGRAFNVSHYIHTVDYGETFPLVDHPLRKVKHVIDNQSGLGVSTYHVKLIPTRYKRSGRTAKDTYQVSVAHHFVHPVTLASSGSQLLPGISFMYDFTPLEVHHTEEREGFFSFLASLISIVGGVFVTVRLVSSLLVETVNIGKKLD
mmetsp:Transcript_23102/g.35649  ORF Transcript_23102/g.35649 Transcript_23102/m.35649 type:complete len:358 (-) Transcript_23102:90-1163(-)|eukprot:CAMPEP_0196813780 /NCGR_PEP_ID=MMETSP1362-20130617/39149_1 /TAXON_ID=163516 /ORGANISM="Leptocylindrus danicus, Strain CCMP1856" /LENGTH=357 /DNA_ID=CAMNT_0042190157 /DNA_START=50 /DNA_END=1123 /DNA_ORIENTATION=+